MNAAISQSNAYHAVLLVPFKSFYSYLGSAVVRAVFAAPPLLVLDVGWSLLTVGILHWQALVGMATGLSCHGYILRKKKEEKTTKNTKEEPGENVSICRREWFGALKHQKVEVEVHVHVQVEVQVQVDFLHAAHVMSLQRRRFEESTRAPSADG